MSPPCKHCGKRRGEHLSSPLWCPETRAGVQYAPADYFHGMRRAMEIATAIMRGAGRNMLALDVEEAVGKEIG